MDAKATDYTIVIEGVDLSGKDTLCLKLAEKYGLDFVHFTSHDPKDYSFYSQSLRKKNVVYSRNWIGEFVYPKFYGRSHSLCLADGFRLVNVSKKNKVKTLILTASDEELQRRLEERGEEQSCVRDNLSKINEAFIKLGKRFQIPIVDTSKTSFEDICSYIETGRVKW